MRPEFIDNSIKKLNKILGVNDIEIWVQVLDGSTSFNKLDEYNLRFVEYEEGLFFIVKSGNIEIAKFILCQLRGCCGICISSGEYVSSPYRKRGVGTVLGKLRKEIARCRGYTVLLCTDVVDNLPQRKILNHHEWLNVFRFRNKRTHNLVDISVVPLDPSYQTYIPPQKEDSGPTLFNPQWKPKEWFTSFFTRKR